MLISDYFNLFLLIGAAISLLISIYLWLTPPKFFSNRALSFLTICWSITVVSFALGSPDFFRRFPHAYGLGSATAYLFFPAFYMYIKSYLYDDARKASHYWWHFIPFLAFALSISPFYFQSGEIKADFIKNRNIEWLNMIFSYGSLVVIAQGIIYSILSINMLQHFQYFRGKRLSNKQLSSIKWILQFVLINIVLWAIGTTGAIMDMLNISTPINPFKIYYLGITILMIVLGYFSIRHPYVISMEASGTLNPVFQKERNENNVTNSADKADLKVITNYIKNERPYLKNDLNLRDLADGTGLTKHRISELLNKELSKSFYDVINEYRINEVIRLIDSGKHKEFTLAHLAEKAGFNSKATFYRVFKKVTGNTPNNYIQSIEV
ncbi:MAG: hypothetical protein BM563_01090 [Bacteroidetes bacterium MedPE-SWsnd-G1]|nr:MAG: hypothetical protein BM563_01090 [Bacteroidetes bacterium MedPE-SWsnd-G1]